MAYAGTTARIPVGSLGLSGSKNPSQMQPGHLKFVEGVLLEGGTIRKQGGAQKLNATTLAHGILDGTSWTVGAVTYDIVFLDNGTVMRGTAGTFGTTLVSGLTADLTPPPVFVAGGGENVGAAAKLFLFSTSNQVKVLNAAATTFASIANPAADWASTFPTFGAQHVGRLWAGGNASDPHRIYYSKSLDHGDFVNADAGTLAIFPGEGQRLVAAISFRDMLVLWKYPTGIYIVNTTDPTPANWQVKKLSRNVGTLSQHTVVPTENDVAYLDHTGNIHMISATNLQGDLNTSNVSHLADIDVFIRDNVQLSTMRRAVAIWYGLRRELWVFLPGIGDDSNTIRLIMNLADQQMGPRFLVSRRDTVKSAWMRQDATLVLRPMVGDDVGYVWQLDHPTLSKDGAAYEMRYETADTDLGYIDPKVGPKAKNFQFLEISSEPKGEWSIAVEVWIDDKLTTTLSYGMGSSSGAIGEFVVGTGVLGSVVLRSDRKKIDGSGRRIRLVVQNGGIDEDISLAEFFVSFTLSDERIRG